MTLGEVARISMILDPDGNWIESSRRARLSAACPVIPALETGARHHGPPHDRSSRCALVADQPTIDLCCRCWMQVQFVAVVSLTSKYGKSALQGCSSNTAETGNNCR